MAFRYRHKILLFVMAVLLALAALWHTLPRKLSPLEQSLVGSWRSTDGPRPCALDLRPDRSFEFRLLDGGEIGPGRYPEIGTWRIRGGILVFDSRSRQDKLLPIRFVQGSRSLRQFQVPALRWLPPGEVQLLAATAEEFTLQPANGASRTWRRTEEPAGK